LRKVFDLKCLAIANTKSRLRLTKRGESLFRIRFGLLDGLTLLLDLSARLVETDVRVSRIEPEQHTSLRYVTSDIEIYLDDLAGNRRCNIGLCVACQVACRLDVGRYRDDRRLRRLDIYD